MRATLTRRRTRCRNDLLPAEHVTFAEAATILGVSSIRVLGLIAEGFLTEQGSDTHRSLVRDQVEELSLATYDWLAHRHERHPYWVTGCQAAETLGVSRDELASLTIDGRLPHLIHPDGTLLYRRQQLLNRRRIREGRGWGQS